MPVRKDKNNTITYILNNKNDSFGYFSPYITGFGLQEKNPNHLHGFIIKPEYTLQYLSEGEGFYYINDKKYTLKAGDMFYLPKNVMVKYKAKQDNPYKYYWVAFDGSGIEKFLMELGFSIDNPVISYSDDKINALLEDIGNYLGDYNNANYMFAIGGLYKFFAYLFSKNNTEQIERQTFSQYYVSYAVSEIKTKYNDGDFNVTSLAKTLGLTREHFSTVFKSITGSSPIDYLMDYRINQAKKMLNMGASVTETAFNTGFNSSANFSVQFKKHVGESPIKYKLKNER